MHDLVLDIRYAVRVLWKSPAFTLVAVLTLMLGIGANVVVFGVMNAVLLHPVDVSDPQNRHRAWQSMSMRASTLIPKSRNCFGSTSAGEPLIKSIARLFFGKAITSRMLCSPQIDKLVYELYELTPDEIKIVEGTTT